MDLLPSAGFETHRATSIAASTVYNSLYSLVVRQLLVLFLGADKNSEVVVRRRRCPVVFDGNKKLMRSLINVEHDVGNLETSLGA